MKVDFSPCEKQTAFEMISSKYFNKNFGMLSKSDYETLLFHIYIEHLLNNNLCFDDYTISRELGISQSRVRNLKVRKELQYPREGFSEHKWKEAFSQSINKAVYDPDTRKVQLHIEDINVLTELRYYLETNGWFDTYQLNPKVFCCRLDFFLQLCKALSEEEIVIDEKIEKKLKKEAAKYDQGSSAIEKICSGVLEDGLKELAVGASKELLLGVLSLLPFGGVAKTAVEAIIAVINRS